VKRTLAALVATVAGLVVLLTFKTHPGRQPALPAAAGSSGQGRTITGKSVSTRYGDVEIQLTLTGSRITAVTPVKLPDSNEVDQEIDQQAVPILIQETLTAQSATIDAVSGATYTSDGYVRSLQSALDKAKS
jgi:uncharacterized protein with FMN-binding domain